MGSKTGISWTDATWNPIRGCSRVSEGCRNCYAESVAYRFSGSGMPYQGLAVLKNGHASWTGEVRFVEEHLMDPIRWKKPRKIFVNSMSDLFHENVTDEIRDKIFAVMALCPQHTFQVLTKRPERMQEYCSSVTEDRFRSLVYAGKGPRVPWFIWPLPNVWLGVSVEDQEAADERIPLLLKTPAVVRFISAEPLLGELHIKSWLHPPSGLNWVITGGESGSEARPMLSGWASSIQQKCEAVGVAYFHKQNGEWVDSGHEEFGKLPTGKKRALRSDGTEWDLKDMPEDENADVNTVVRVGRRRAGDTLYGKVYHEFPEVEV